MTLLLALLLGSANAAWAGGRTQDSRTALPETIIKERQEWGTDLSLGYDLLAGNVEQTILRTSASAFKRWAPYTGYAAFKINYVTALGFTVRNDWNGTARVDRKIASDWKIFAYTTDARNAAVLLDYRGQVGAGPWLDVDQGSVHHGISLASAYQYEKFLTGESRRQIRAALRYVLSWRVTPYSRAGLDSFFAPAVNDFSNYRASVFPFVEADVWEKYLALRVQLSTEYDNKPIAGVKYTDNELSTSLTFRLGE